MQHLFAGRRLSFVALLCLLASGVANTFGDTVDVPAESGGEISAAKSPVLYFSIQGTLLGIPKNYFKRIPVNAASTPREALAPDSLRHAVVFAVLPSMEGQNAQNADCFSMGEACDDAVRIVIDSASFVSADERAQNILKYAPSDAELRRVAPDLFVLEHSGSKNDVQYFGVLENGSMIPFHCRTFVTEQQVRLKNSCRVAVPMMGGFSIDYYFDPSYSNQWRSVYDAVQRLVRSFVVP